MQKWRVCVQIGKVAGHLAQDFACTVLRYGGLPFAARMNLQIHPDFKQRIQSEFGLHHHQIGRIDQLAQQLLVDQSQPFVVFGIEGQQIVQQPVKCILFNINCAILKRRFIVGNRRLYLIEMQKQIISHGHMISISCFPCEICAFCVPQHWLWNSLLRNISPKVRPVGRLLQPPRPKQPFWDQVSLHRDIRNQIRCSKLLICQAYNQLNKIMRTKGKWLLSDWQRQSENYLLERMSYLLPSNVMFGSIISMGIKLCLCSRHEPLNIEEKYGLWHK